METPLKGGMSELVLAIGKANQYFKDQAQRRVNTSLTLRNWIIGLRNYGESSKKRGKKYCEGVSVRPV